MQGVDNKKPEKHLFRVVNSMPRYTKLIGYFWAYDRKRLGEYLDKHDIHWSDINIVLPFDIDDEVV